MDVYSRSGHGNGENAQRDHSPQERWLLPFVTPMTQQGAAYTHSAFPMQQCSFQFFLTIRYFIFRRVQGCRYCVQTHLIDKETEARRGSIIEPRSYASTWQVAGSLRLAAPQSIAREPQSILQRLICCWCKHGLVRMPRHMVFSIQKSQIREHSACLCSNGRQWKGRRRHQTRTNPAQQKMHFE